MLYAKEEIKATKPIKDNIQETPTDLTKQSQALLRSVSKAGKLIINDRVYKIKHAIIIACLQFPC